VICNWEIEKLCVIENRSIDLVFSITKLPNDLSLAIRKRGVARSFPDVVWREEMDPVALETCPRITQLGESPELSDRGIGSNYPITKLLNYQI